MSCSWRCRRRPGGRGFHRNVASRMKLLFSLEVPPTHRCLTGFFINDDGLIVCRARRRARSGDRGLTAKYYPLGYIDTSRPDECSSGKRNRVAVMRVCIMDRLHIRVRAVGMVNCRPRVRGKSNAQK